MDDKGKNQYVVHICIKCCCNSPLNFWCLWYKWYNIAGNHPHEKGYSIESSLSEDLNDDLSEFLRALKQPAEDNQSEENCTQGSSSKRSGFVSKETSEIVPGSVKCIFNVLGIYLLV